MDHPQRSRDRLPLSRWSRRAALGALAATAGGCAFAPPPTRVPMDLTRIAGPCAGRAPTLLVLLPGAYSKPAEFVEEGYIDALQARSIAADVVIADAHFGYFAERSILRRLREDIVQPARAQGYARIWLVGISLGGFGALGYAVRHPGEVDGVLALAPYLGRRTLLKEIIDAGGPRAWRARPPPAAEDDDLERELWLWLAAGAPPPPQAYLGFGREDRFADAHRSAAALLGPDRAFDAPGGHDWPAWRTLWSSWLDRGVLAGTCAP